MGSAIRAVVEFASRNGGVVTIQEAVALGMSSSTLQRRVEEGLLVRRRPGVLSLPGSADEHLLDLHMACRKLRAVVSHESAALLHGLHRSRQIQPTVSVPRNSTKDLAGVVVHQVLDLDPDHVKTLLGLPITIPERTVFDLAAVLPEVRLAKVVDHGLASGRIQYEKLDDLFALLGRRGKPGTRALRRILESRGHSYEAPESELERQLLLTIERGNLPEPIRQFRAPWLRSINGRVDLAYPDRRLLIEGDSRRWHLLAEAFENDRIRDNAAQLAGWRILRFTWNEIKRNPERVIGTIRRALEDERF